jgi:hypothetical protein
MENAEILETAVQQPGCLSCGSPDIEQGYANPLCKTCRERFIKFPVPFPIKLFALAVCAILILSMIRLPKNLSAGIHLQKGKNAERKTNYLTAQREYNQVLKLIPGLVDAKCHLLIASFHNMDFQTVFNITKELQGKNIEDQNLYYNMDNAIQGMSKYLPSDSFNNEIEKYHSADSIPAEVYNRYIRLNPTELFPIINYSSILLNKNQYTQCDSFLNIALVSDAQHLATLTIKTSVKRELHQFDSAMYYCDLILKQNKESTFGISSKARTYFRLKEDKEGLRWALKSYDLDNKDPYTIATLAMAYHLNNKIAERDKLMEATKNDSAVLIYMQYVKDVISGKEKFRD